MPYFPQSAAGINYVTYPSLYHTQLPGAGTNNTKGAFVQYVASTTFASNEVQVGIGVPNVTNNALGFLFDVATGAAGSEVVRLANIVTDSGIGYGGVGGMLQVPLAIAAGTRVACRSQSTVSSDSIGVALTLIAAGDAPGCATYTTYGANTATTNGTAVDPGGSANTKGAYVQLSASTAAVTQSLLFDASLNLNGNPQLAVWDVDIATGAAASEVVLMPNLPMALITTLNWGPIVPRGRSFLTYIAASTRLAVRACCNITDATDRVFACVLLGSVAPGESAAGVGAFAWAS